MSFPLYSEFSPADVFDLRCEYDVPRYLDLNDIESGKATPE